MPSFYNINHTDNNKPYLRFDQGNAINEPKGYDKTGAWIESFVDNDPEDALNIRSQNINLFSVNGGKLTLSDKVYDNNAGTWGASTEVMSLGKTTGFSVTTEHKINLVQKSTEVLSIGTYNTTNSDILNDDYRINLRAATDLNLICNRPGSDSNSAELDIIVSNTDASIAQGKINLFLDKNNSNKTISFSRDNANPPNYRMDIKPLENNSPFMLILHNDHDFFIKTNSEKRFGIDNGLVGLYNTNDQDDPYLFFDQGISANSSKPIVGSYIFPGDNNLNLSPILHNLNILLGDSDFNIWNNADIQDGSFNSTTGPSLPTLKVNKDSMLYTGFGGSQFLVGQALTIQGSPVKIRSAARVGDVNNTDHDSIFINSERIYFSTESVSGTPDLSGIGSSGNPLNTANLEIKTTTGQVVAAPARFSFTGCHVYKKLESEDLSLGDSVYLDYDVAKKVNSSNSKLVCGIVVYTDEVSVDNKVLTSFGENLTSGSYVIVASTGDNIYNDCKGFNVCDENGPVSAGDLLVTSNYPGYLMKQDDDIIRSKTVGKAMVDVEFDEAGFASNIYGFIYCG